jgi:hypothetical protein
LSEIKVNIEVGSRANGDENHAMNGQFTTFDPNNRSGAAANRISADNINRPKFEVGLKLPPAERSSIGERSRNKASLGNDNVRS